MKFRKNEIPFIIEFYNKDLKDLGLENAKAKPYFNGIMNFYFNSVKDSIYGKVQIEKAKYLLGKNSSKELEFQKEVFVDMINSILALPDEKLATTDKGEASKFMVENYNQICSLLLIDKLVGPQFNSGALKDFGISADVIEALKHKRELLDPTKDVKPSVKYDGIFLNKNNGIQVSVDAKIIDLPVEGYDRLQDKLFEIGQGNGRFERDSFDDFIEIARTNNDKIGNMIHEDPNISTENKRTFVSFFNKMRSVRGLLGGYASEFGENTMVYNAADKYNDFVSLAMAINQMPAKLINSIPKDSEAYAPFTEMIAKLRNTDVCKGVDELAITEAMNHAIKKQSVKALYANIDLLRNKLGQQGYQRQISDWQLVSKVHDFMLDNPKQGVLYCLDDAINHVAYEQRTIGEELEFQKRLVKQGAARETGTTNWGKIANGIAKIEILKTMPADQLLDVNALDTKAVELLKENPNINLNISMHDRKIVDDYFDNPQTLLNDFHYKDPQVQLIDLNTEYNRFRQVVVNELGPQDSLPENKIITQPDALSLKAYKLKECESRIDVADGLGIQMQKSYNHPGFKGWSRLSTYFLNIPQSKEDVLKNYEFIQNLYENKLQPSGLTFRQQVLKDSIEMLKGLDPAELSNLDNQQLIDNWQKLNQTWGLAFVARQDLLGACAAEGLVVSDEDRAALDFINDQSTFIFQSLGQRKARLCNQYTAFTDGMSGQDFDIVDFDDSFGPKMGNIQANGLNAVAAYPGLSVKNLALVNAGISTIKDVLHTKFVTYDEKGVAKEEPCAFYKIAQTDNKTFSIQEPGKEPVFYHYDGKGAYFQAKSIAQMNEFLKPHDVTIHIDAGKEYENDQYIDAFATAHAELTDKIKNGANITKEDIARSLVMQDINAKLRDHSGDEDEYHIALQAFVNEDFIKGSIDAMMANPAFDQLVDKMGGVDESGFIKRQNQQNYLNMSALEDYQQINADIMQGKEIGGWNDSLDRNASLAKIEEYKKLLQDDEASLGVGNEGPHTKRCRENVFRIALLQKNIDENLGMTTKEIEDKANALTFDPKYKAIRDSILRTDKVAFAANNILNPKEGDYPWSKRVYKLLDRCEEIRKPGFETDDMFVERKLSEAGITDENVIKTTKEEFSKLAQTNNLIRYGNPDKVMSNEDLWTILTDKNLENEHNIASEQMTQLHHNQDLRENNSGAKTYFNRNMFANVKENPQGLEFIKQEKARVLLQGNTGEALDFQKEYAADLINKLLALPDDKLAMHGTPEARQYYAEHYEELYMLFEVENFMGGTGLAGGVRNDFEIPQDIVDVLRHKKDLAQENLMGDEGYIKALGNENYRIYSILNEMNPADLSQMQSVPGEFGADRELVNLIGQVILTKTNQIERASTTQPDSKYDNYHLDIKNVKIKARFERGKSMDDFTKSFNESVDKSQITVNDKFEAFEQKLGNFKLDFSNKINEADKAKVYEDLKKSCDEYVSSLVTNNTPFNKLSAPDKAAVKTAKQISGFCKDQKAYHTMKSKVHNMETELGIKDHKLDLSMNPERDYTKQMYENIIGENRGLVEGVVKDDIKNNKVPNPDHLARLVALDTLYKQVTKSNMPAEYVKSFLSEDYIQHNVDAIKETAEFKTFISKNEPITEKFVEFDLSEKIRDTIQDMKVKKESQKIEKDTDLSRQEEVKSLT